MKDLECLRKEIDHINKDIIELFIKRLEVSEEIGAYKKANNMPIFDKAREEIVLKENLEGVDEKYRELLREFLLNLMDSSKKIQGSSDGNE